MNNNNAFKVALAVAFGIASTGAHAITITATQDTNSLTNALLAGASTGILVTNTTLSGHQDSLSLAGIEFGTLTTSGTYTNASNTYGIGAGVVLSTGGVQGVSSQGVELMPGYDDGPNSVANNGYPFGTGFDITTVPDPDDPPALGTPATAAQELLLDPITGDQARQIFWDHFDVTELIINFDMQAGYDRVSFNVVFGSEEYPEYVDKAFIDGFGMFLNGVNIAQVANQPVNIKHPDMTNTILGTELDGILAPGGNPVLSFGGLVNPTGNTLRFIVADTTDGILDTTVYFSALGGVPEVPLPASVWLLGTAVGGLLGRTLVRRSARAVEAT